jgi:AraC-like DNA-binding protein
MDSSAACNIEHEVQDRTAQIKPSPLTAAPGIELDALDYEAWRVLPRSVCGRYSPEGVELNAFATPDLPRISSHTDKLFKRICSIIRDRFADPDFGPCEAADEAGISLRYLQKLFTARSSSCTHFIRSIRLDHAARLLRHRALLNTRQPVSQAAYASGFNDYTHFARQFRRRFGHPPGAYGSREAGAQ